MVESRILGAGMILLFPLRFLINKASEIKAAGHFYKFFVVNCLFSGFHRGIIFTLRLIRVCDYLFLSNLHLRFIMFGCRSIPMMSVGGEKNDYIE